MWGLFYLFIHFCYSQNYGIKLWEKLWEKCHNPEFFSEFWNERPNDENKIRIMSSVLEF